MVTAIVKEDAGEGTTAYVYDDGGRAAAGYRGDAGDCSTRAMAIAMERPYMDVYRELSLLVKQDPKTRGVSARDGVPQRINRRYMEECGWEWVPTMQIGSGCQVHLRADELPAGRLVVRLSKHLCALVDSVIHDTYDPSRDGTHAMRVWLLATKR